jgi:2,4-dichlorophenol 6-monooxygenase
VSISNAQEFTKVLIVGGGVSGLTASLLLSKLSIDHVLVERHSGTAQLPKAHIINQRTMEIYRDLGVADEIYAAGSPPDKMSTIAWVTSLAGPTPLHGRRIARTDAWCGGPAYDAASPCRATNLPQLRLEPLLRRHAERHATAKICFGNELVSLRDEGTEVRAEILDRQTGRRRDLVASYVVVADGGRTVGPKLGVVLEGERGLLDMVSTHFTADLSDHWPDESVVISFSVNPDGEGSLGSGVLLPMGPDLWGAKSTEWQYHSALHTGDPDQFDHQLMIERMRDMLGLPDLEPVVHSVSRWRFEGVVADRYRVGRCFLVGDAVHRHPPNGGLGLNTAVGDVQNLVWKLAQVINGWADDALLDSYEPERRPVGRAVVARALANWQAHPGIDAALGLADAADAGEAWSRVGELFEETAAGHGRRQAVDKAIAATMPEFTGQDIELGYRYSSSVIVTDPSPDPSPDPGLDPGACIQTRQPGSYEPKAVPGATVPHAWLLEAGSGERVSTLDLVTLDRYALLVAPAAAARWRAALADAADGTGIPADRVMVQVLGAAGSPADYIDADGRWQELRGGSDGGALLLRPDRHIAWRVEAFPDAAPDHLREVLSTVLTPRRTDNT